MNYKVFLLFRVFNSCLSQLVLLDFRDGDLKAVKFDTVIFNPKSTGRLSPSAALGGGGGGVTHPYVK